MKRDEKNEYLKNLKGRKFLILGGGLSGRAATKLLENLSQKLLLCDKTPQMGLNCPQETDELKNFRYFKPDLIIKSPGISPDHPILQSAKQTQTPIWSEIDLAYLFFKGKIIAITGTDGKSTSTALTGHLLQASGFKTKTGGNIGLPFSEICLDDIDLAVLELSSYQLDDSQFFRAETGCILNIAPDHLERHKTMENYAEAKKKIFLENTNSILNEKLKNLYELNKETFPNLI
ncbi:MAG: UDP-N-acetylmuramoyl-L-alanine--D-glutamate ligase, partial [Leptospiraceae bacterium]|nr:UDP-N-acetylmuramoyl-L-alanine--D-glutamate ligase [Leptospiraceae bacterium]